jgi:hypothetical protein
MKGLETGDQDENEQARRADTVDTWGLESEASEVELRAEPSHELSFSNFTNALSERVVAKRRRHHSNLDRRFQNEALAGDIARAVALRLHLNEKSEKSAEVNESGTLMSITRTTSNGAPIVFRSENRGAVSVDVKRRNGEGRRSHSDGVWGHAQL